MENRIEGIQSVSRLNRVESIRGYTKKEVEEKIRQIEKESEERMEIHKYLANFPNPDNLTFAELLEKELKLNGEKSVRDDVGYILDIK